MKEEVIHLHIWSCTKDQAINSKTESKPKQETIKAIKVLQEVMTIME